ncbi:hypothetical protein DFAR_850009 [Desulfarculales bacterium]
MGAHFDEAPTAIWLRRFRCPGCRVVIRLRPRGYWSRFQALVGPVRQSLANKLARGRWDPVLPRFRPAPLAQGSAAAGEPTPGIRLVGRPA